MAKPFRSVVLVVSAVCGSAVPLLAQAPGVRIEEQSFAGLEQEERALGEQVGNLGSDRLLSEAMILKQLEAPIPRRLDLPEPEDRPATPVRIAERARRGAVRLGWCYLCENCDNWHFELAAGYAIDKDGAVATCAHVLEPLGYPSRQATLVGVDHHGVVHPVTAVLAMDRRMDAAIVDLSTPLEPLALEDGVRPGDAAYCFGRPLDQRGYFSQGMVNRFYWDQLDRGGDDTALRALRHLRLNVSTAWAPGSSGGAVLDRLGNVIGHVSEIAPLGGGGSEAGGEAGGEGAADTERPPSIDEVTGMIPLLTLHVAIPARSTLALARATSAAAGSSGGD